MHASRPRHGAPQAHPIPDRGHFAEGDPGLGHAPGTGIHADEHDPFGAVRIPPEVRFMDRGRIPEGIVDVADGRVERKRVHRIGEAARGGRQCRTWTGGSRFHAPSSPSWKNTGL
jgi:hypothetical protein